MTQSNRISPLRTHSRHLLVGVGLATATVLALLPPGLADKVRAPVTTALLPAQRGLAVVRCWGSDAAEAVGNHFTDTRTAAQREADNRRLAEENRQLKAALETAEHQLKLLAQRDRPEPALLAARCVPARILGIAAQAYLARHHLIDAGRSLDVEPGSPVLQSATPLVDCGTNAGVESGNVLLAGSRVWGKIAMTGPYTSTVCPVTAPGYRDLVRLAAPSPDGHPLRFGAKGILEGTGESLARLRMVETTEPVAEGDLVYSQAAQGFVELPLLCGTVARVERPPGAGYWEIWVAPAVETPPENPVILCPQAQPAEPTRSQDPLHAARSE